MADKLTQVYAYYEYLRTIRNKSLRKIMGPVFDVMGVGDFNNAMMEETEHVGRAYEAGEIDKGEALELQRKFMDIQNLITEVSGFGSRGITPDMEDSDYHQLNDEMRRYEAVIRQQASVDSVNVPDLSDDDIREIYDDSAKYTKQNREFEYMSPAGTPWDQRNDREKQVINDRGLVKQRHMDNLLDFYYDTDMKDIRGSLNVDGFRALQSTYDTTDRGREYNALGNYKSKYFGEQDTSVDQTNFDVPGKYDALLENRQLRVDEDGAYIMNTQGEWQRFKLDSALGREISNRVQSDSAEDPEVSATVEEDPIPDTGVIDQEDYDRFKEQAEDPAVDPIETITEGGGVKIPDDFGELSNMMRDAGYEHFHVRHPDAMPYWTHKETGFDIQHTELREFLEAGGLQDPSVEEQWEADRDSGNRQPVFAMERQQVEWEEKQEKLRINREQREDPEFQIRQMIDGLNQAMEGDNHNYWLSQYDFNRDGSLSPADTLAITNAYNNGGMDEVNALTEAHGEWNLNQQREQTPQWDGDWTPGRSDAEGWSGPGPNDMTTQAVVEWVNPETGEMTSNNTGGWSPPPGSAWIRKDRYESLYGDIDNSRIIRPDLADLGVAPFPDEEVFVDENNTTSGLSESEGQQFLEDLQVAEEFENELDGPDLETQLDNVEIPSYENDVLDNYQDLYQTYDDDVNTEDEIPADTSDVYNPADFTGNIQGTESELGAINNFVSDYAAGEWEDFQPQQTTESSDGGLFNSNGILNTSESANNNTGNNNKLAGPPAGLAPIDRLKWIQDNSSGPKSTSTTSAGSAFDPDKWKPKQDTASVFKPLGSLKDKNKLKSTTLTNSLLGK